MIGHGQYQHIVGMASSESLRRIGMANLSVGCVCVGLQSIVTVMAYVYHGLYAWNWDAPLLSKCMTGVFTGSVCLVLSYIQLDAARVFRKLTQTDLSQRICSIKLFSCFLLLFGLLLFGISLYLITVLFRWLAVTANEYEHFVRGPVMVSVILNVGLALVAVCTVCLALLGLFALPDL
ncbi:hypothetical protein BV898_16166 [Hypsibius exemplaris]|uniref:Uncharacterized protein n=1 Tax=Hypsibius exemplaris TaxID=2072580 RepID=A0A9X6RKW6_HYPEX|nr:hypothetical protein BV898_16166 [Hypsibius exemplaris]